MDLSIQSKKKVCITKKHNNKKNNIIVSPLPPDDKQAYDDETDRLLTSIIEPYIDTGLPLDEILTKESDINNKGLQEHIIKIYDKMKR